MPRNNRKPRANCKKWYGKMEKLSVHDHLSPVIKLATEVRSRGGNEHSPTSMEVTHEEVVMEEEDEGKEEISPLTSIIPLHCESTKCEDWGPELKKLLVETTGIEKLRPLFVNNERAWQKVGDMEYDEMKEALDLDGQSDETFLRLLSAFVSVDVIRKRLGLSRNWAYHIYEDIRFTIAYNDEYEFEGDAVDLREFWDFCNPGFKLAPNNDNYDE